jgi:hypothetical protein
MATRASKAKAEQIGTTILEQLAELEPQSMSRQTAKKILELSFSRQQQKRAELLADRAQAGELSASEQAELDEYIRVADLLAILQSKARRSLADIDGSSGTQ